MEGKSRKGPFSKVQSGKITVCFILVGQNLGGTNLAIRIESPKSA